MARTPSGRLLRRALRRAYPVTGRAALASGKQIWGTKSFEFWSFLALTLWTARPRTILELGSGRSTGYLADYAQKEGVPFVSIEQSRGFALRIRRSLRAGFLDPSCVQRVPVEGDWYDVARVDALAPRPVELLYVDGPVGAQERLGRASRTGPTARSWLLAAGRAARVIVVDDVHRRANLALASELAEAGGLMPLFLAYVPRRGTANVAAVLVEPGVAERLLRVCGEVGIAASRDYDEERCTEP